MLVVMTVSKGLDMVLRNEHISHYNEVKRGVDTKRKICCLSKKERDFSLYLKYEHHREFQAEKFFFLF